MRALSDLVVDTNVLVHAASPSDPHFDDSLTLLRRLMETRLPLCIDREFDFALGQNSSLIGYEYLTNLQPGSLPFAALVALFSTGRVRQYDRKVPNQVRSLIERLIQNTRDRTFLRIAYKSESRLLVSHDFIDFPSETRRELLERLGIRVVTAAEAVILLMDIDDGHR